jgi:hypothetical protein
MIFIRFLVFFSFVFCGAFADIYNPLSIGRPALKLKSNDEFNVSVELINEVFFDNIRTNNTSRNRAYIYLRPNIAVNFNKFVGFETNWNFEDVGLNYRNPLGVRDYFGQNRGSQYFSYQGLIFEQAKLRLGNDHLKVYFGKFNPAFGAGFNRYSREFFDNNWYGAHGTFLNTAYELREKIGMNAEIYTAKINDFTSKFNIALFRNDSTPLFDSLLTSKNADYYPNKTTNSNDLLGFSLDFRGAGHSTRFTNRDDNLSYTVSYRELPVKKRVIEGGGVQKERAFAFSSQYYIFVLEGLKIGTFAEMVRIFNYNGFDNNRHDYKTFSLYANFHGLNLASLINTFKNNLNQSKLDIFTREISIGYDHPIGLGVYISNRLIKYTAQDVYNNSLSLRYRIYF